MSNQKLPQNQNNAKRYSHLKYALTITDTVYLLVLLFIFLGSGLSTRLCILFSDLAKTKFIVLPLYFFAAFIGFYILSLPLNFYRTYTLEHKFSLSIQKISGWVIDQIKQAVLFYIIGLILVIAFYLVLKYFPNIWWLVISIFWIFFSLILAKLTPLIIIPLFFKYKKLGDETLRQRILKLSETMKVKILDVFEIDFSKKTLKANAAFVGVGGSRRVLLADTLKDKYTHDEIEVILAHEFAHYKLRHLLKMLLVNSTATVFLFYLIFKTSAYALKFFSLSSLSDISSLPLVATYFVLFGVITQPFEAWVSRILERDADTLAIKMTGLKEAFILTMDKLGKQNLADRSPHPLIKFYFFDHPPIDERIAMARRLH